jgi:hemerythrin-like domain-containing protein
MVRALTRGLRQAAHRASGRNLICRRAAVATHLSETTMSHADDADAADDDDLRPSDPDDGGGLDAIELLNADHDEMLQMFEDYESLLGDDSTDEERELLAHRICSALTVHAAIEEEILYPVANELLDDNRLVDVALAEHASAEELIGELRQMSADELRFDEKVAALGVLVQRHIDAEEEDLLPLLAEQGADLQRLGRRLARRKQELADEEA